MPGRHILVVDDSVDVRETLAEVLELAGFTVRQAENGKVALEMLVEQRPALVLLDLMMPVMSGWEVLDAMRADPALTTIPVVVISAAAAVPADVLVLRKSVSVEALLEAVRSRTGGPPKR